ncbi:MAG TPA: dynamin family protein, partial [Blastocatellia bacterium]
MNQRCDKIIRLAADVAQRYGISSLDPLLTSCRAVADQSDLGVAVIGRFKAGKSSFLNHLFGRNLLPVGAVPVTTIITRVCCGPTEKATVDFLDGRTEEIAVGDIRRFIAESENPENIRRVSKLTVELPALARLKGLCFIDTPGLESSLAHNTEASLQWLPNVELAIVAVSADTPLSRRDIDLLKSLSRHTPEISILLTKVDLVDESELDEILSFIRQQLERVFNPAPPIFPYSVRPGFEHLRAEIEDRLTGGALANFQHQRRAIIERKLETLAGECIDYLNLALVSAEMIESEREALRKQVVGEKEFVDDAKSEMRLLIRHEAGGARSAIASLLQTHRAEIETRLLEELKAEFTGWTKSLRHSLESFEDWLQSSLSEKLAAIS